MEDFGGKKFLAIKNWDRFQPDVKHPTYIRDYVNREDDRDFARLTGFQRAILEGLCRYRGRSGKWPQDDCVWIARCLQIVRKEAHCVPYAVRVLTAFGFLIPTGQQLSSNETHIREKRREDKRREEDKKLSPTQASLELGAAEHFKGQKLIITEKNHAAFMSAYEGADLEAEYLKMDAWLVSNKRSYHDFGRFANNWLSRMRMPAVAGTTREYKTTKQKIAEARAAQRGGGQ